MTDSQEQPLISVVITTYNYGRFVEECIDSVLAQDYPSDRVEVIVVDDGSTDDTAERVKRYGTRIEYLRKANGGQASALNAGFAKARGEIISLLGADDYFLPGKLARVAEAFLQDPGLGMFYHPFLEFDMGTGERRKSGQKGCGCSGSNLPRCAVGLRRTATRESNCRCGLSWIGGAFTWSRKSS